MTGTEFAVGFRDKPMPVWEAAVVRAAQNQDLVPWNWVPVDVPNKDGKKVTVYVQTDVVSVGDPTDFLRMPLTPDAAQAVADAYDSLLPTTKLSRAIASSAKVKLDPEPSQPTCALKAAPPYCNPQQIFDSYVVHNNKVHDQMMKKGAQATDFVTGHKKDVVIVAKPFKGRVAIYGWFRPDGTFIQGLNPKDHDEGYVDYSHGIRLVKDRVTIDGVDYKLSDVLKDPSKVKLVSDEGVPFEKTRYGEKSLTDQGLASFTRAAQKTPTA